MLFAPTKIFAKILKNLASFGNDICHCVYSNYAFFPRAKLDNVRSNVRVHHKYSGVLLQFSRKSTSALDYPEFLTKNVSSLHKAALYQHHFQHIDRQNGKMK